MSHLSTATPSPCPLPTPLAAAARVLQAFTAPVPESPTPRVPPTRIAAMLARLRERHARRLAESRIAARAAIFAPYSKSPQTEARAEAFFNTPNRCKGTSRAPIGAPPATPGAPAEAALVQSANAASATPNADPRAQRDAPAEAALVQSTKPDSLPDPHEWTEAEVVDTIFRALRDAFLNGGELNRSALIAKGITHALIDLCEGEAWRRFTAWRDARMARRG